MAAALTAVIPQLGSGGFRFFGRWFGAPFDNTYRLVEARSEGEDVVLTFGEGETLRVTRPAGVTVATSREKLDQPILTIQTADRIRWQWRQRPLGATAVQDFVEEYETGRDGVHVNSDLRGRALPPASAEQPAVVFV